MQPLYLLIGGRGRKAVVTYALSTYIMDYGYKPAEYAFGIIRNTSEPEARQGMMRLQNQKQRQRPNKTWGDRNESSGTSDKQRRADELDALSL
nr:hypothetical protein [Brevibacillus laterosporus]